MKVTKLTCVTARSVINITDMVPAGIVDSQYSTLPKSSTFNKTLFTVGDRTLISVLDTMYNPSISLRNLFEPANCSSAQSCINIYGVVTLNEKIISTNSAAPCQKVIVLPTKL